MGFEPQAAGVDLSATPRPRPGVAQVEVDGEVVAFAAETGGTHHLNAPATAVWKCLDGRTTLDELARDIAAVTEWERPAVTQDLVELMRRFGRQGLIVGVGPTPTPAARTRPDRAEPRFLRVPPDG